MTEYCLGPLTRLQVLGLICPCMLSEEDSAARKSYVSLLPLLSRGVIYHKPTSNSSKSSHHDQEDSSKTFLGSLAAGFLKSASAATSSSSSQESFDKIQAQLLLVHGFRNSIVLKIIPSSLNDQQEEFFVEEEEEEEDDDDSEVLALQNKKCIILPFQQIGLVITASGSQFGGGGGSTCVIVYGKQSQHNPSGKGDELLRFNLEDSQKKQQTSDLVDYLMTLIHWDRNRRKYLDEDENEESNTGKDGKKNFLKTKAEKAAHFAKRELEMQQLKREREQRKQKYLKDTGGLKYTAMAMANME